MVVQKTLLGSQTLAGSAVDSYSLIASDETKQLAMEEVKLLCNTATGVVNATLPEISSLPAQNVRVTVFDSGNLAGTSNITITAGGTDKINGAATKVINSNSGSFVLAVAKDGQWIAE